MPIINVNEAALKILNQLNNSGYEAYVVGGCVRDSLMGIEPHDWDICTNATPDQVEAVFQDYHVIETGLKHGTVTVAIEGEPYEVTTFREDGTYEDHRRPDSVTFVCDLQTDISRRDFTINAMAADASGKVIDLFGGIEDLENGMIRCVGDPVERFSEDALRILRAMRFASRFGFVIENRTADAMRYLKESLTFVSAERKNKELCGVLMGKPKSVLISFPDILSVLIPEIALCVEFAQHSPWHTMDVWEHTVTAVAAAPQDLTVRLALLYHDLGKPACFSMDDNGCGHFYGHPAVSREIAERSMKDLRFDNQTTRDVLSLVESHDREIQCKQSSILRCLNRFGKDLFYQLLDVKEADNAAQSDMASFDKGPIITMTEEIISAKNLEDGRFGLKDLAVNGNDLIGIGYQPGKKLGSVLNYLLNKVIEQKIANEREPLLDLAASLLALRI